MPPNKKGTRAATTSPFCADYMEDYRSIPSLTEYLTVAQDQTHIEHWNLIHDHWTLTDYREADATLTLQSLPAQLHLRNIYARTS